MPRKRVNEEKVIYALKRVESGANEESLSRVGDKRTDVVQLEAEVQGDGSGRAAPLEGVRGREPAIERAGGGSDAGQAYFAGGAVKKNLRPVRKRELAQEVVERFEVSAKRTCDGDAK